ncbi:uncharacterized protein LOC120667855 [Panicum virgatum]|uniref:uncharacterized protein LOC120667855 n=1 Tax=Panicum virgatum TaxID=38727 RepID=UPI0019D61FB9|nr:uncharacterized protein LOC120667855 [Panicum virgatum]
MGIRPELYAEETDTGTVLPVAATTLSKTERREFCEFLHGLKVPSGYSSNFKRLVSVKDMKLNFHLMKSHDCHVLMTALLPVALRGIKTVLVREAIMSLCFFFNAIEQKVIDVEALSRLERRHFETLCLLEATFPPSFFDLMVHLTAHLAKEIFYLGPSYLHQMFPYERFYGFLKSLVHNRSLPEGAMVRDYGTIEAVEWAMGYKDPQNPIGVPHSWHEGNPNRNEAWVAKKHMQGFNTWLRDYVQKASAAITDNLIRKLAAGPLFTITTYQAYDINRYTFYTIAQDGKSIYQNIGVGVDAIDNDIEKDTYYDELFIFAKDVQQVFYVPDLAKKNWYVVMPGKRRIVGVENVVEEEEYNQFDKIPSLDMPYRPQLLANDKTPYLRSNHQETINVRKARKKQV